MKLAFRAYAFRAWAFRSNGLGGLHVSGSFRAKIYAVPRLGGKVTAVPKYLATISKAP